MDRPVRRLPSGESGVVYGGDVYPVHQASAGSVLIELDDACLPKDRCPSFVGVDEPIIYMPSGLRLSGIHRSLLPERWAIETNRFGHYVVFDGDEDLAEAVIDRLESAGFVVRRWGASIRAAADGYFYNWFVRLTYDGTAEECRASVRDALSRGSDREAAPNDAVDLEARLDALEGLTTTLKGVLTAQVERSTMREVELAEARDRNVALREELRGLRAELAAAHGTSDSLRSNLDVTQAANASATHQELAAAIRVAREDATEWQQLADSLDTDNASLREENGTLREALRDAEDRTVALATTPPRRRSRLRESALHRRVWRHLVLDESVLDLIEDVQQCRDPSALWAVIHQLENRQPVALKQLAGVPGVKEVDAHLRTGAPGMRDRARLYVRSYEDRLVVYAQRKGDEKDQARFAERVARADLSELADW